jgi:hypothetical protein
MRTSKNKRGAVHEITSAPCVDLRRQQQTQQQQQQWGCLAAGFVQGASHTAHAQLMQGSEMTCAVSAVLARSTVYNKFTICYVSSCVQVLSWCWAATLTQATPPEALPPLTLLTYQSPLPAQIIMRAYVAGFAPAWGLVVTSTLKGA